MRHAVLVAVLAGFIVALGASRAGAAPALDPARDTADQFFGLTKVYTFHLTIAAADFQKMPPPGGRGGGRGRGGGQFAGGDIAYTKVLAKLQFDGKDWGALTIRYKGNSSYGGSPSELKRSLKLDFDAPDKSRAFFGMPKLNLNNNAFDPSQMREVMAYDVFRRAGVPAPRTAFAKVFITVPGEHTQEYAGLFTVVEEIDQAFFKERLGAKVGTLVKPEGLRGMPDLGDDWASYAARYVSKVTAKPDDAARFVAFVRFVNRASDEEFAARIGDYLDVDEFLRFLAGEVVLVNTDSPLGMNHNYWVTVRPDTHKVIWVPWDMNMAFGGFGVGDADLSLHQPSAPGTFPLADRMLATPALAKRYDQIVRDMVTTNASVKRLDAQMKTVAAAIRAAVATDPTTTVTAFERHLVADPGAAPQAAQNGFGFPGGRGRGGPPLRQFIASRADSVVAQLDGRREGTPGRNRGFGGGRPQFPPR